MQTRRPPCKSASAPSFLGAPGRALPSGPPSRYAAPPWPARVLSREPASSGGCSGCSSFIYLLLEVFVSIMVMLKSSDSFPLCEQMGFLDLAGKSGARRGDVGLLRPEISIETHFFPSLPAFLDDVHVHACACPHLPPSASSPAPPGAPGAR